MLKSFPDLDDVVTMCNMQLDMLDSAVVQKYIDNHTLSCRDFLTMTAADRLFLENRLVQLAIDTGRLHIAMVLDMNRNRHQAAFVVNLLTLMVLRMVN